MAWHVTVKRLREILSKYPDDSVVMISSGPRDDKGSISYNIEEDVTPAYRNDEGEVFTDDDLEEDESVARAERVIIIWPSME